MAVTASIFQLANSTCPYLHFPFRYNVWGNQKAPWVELICREVPKPVVSYNTHSIKDAKLYNKERVRKWNIYLCLNFAWETVLGIWNNSIFRIRARGNPIPQAKTGTRKVLWANIEFGLNLSAITGAACYCGNKWSSVLLFSLTWSAIISKNATLDKVR